VYRVSEGRAIPVTRRLGRRNTEEAQVIQGLQAGDRVVLYPDDALTDARRVVTRAAP